MSRDEDPTTEERKAAALESIDESLKTIAQVFTELWARLKKDLDERDEERRKGTRHPWKKEE